jgi:hypothetical protein
LKSVFFGGLFLTCFYKTNILARNGNKKIDQTKNEKVRVQLYIYIYKSFGQFFEIGYFMFSKIGGLFCIYEKNIWDKNN